MRVGLLRYEPESGVKWGTGLLMGGVCAGVIGALGFISWVESDTLSESDVSTVWIMLILAGVLISAGAWLCWGTKSRRSGLKPYRGVMWDNTTCKGAQGRFVLTMGPHFSGMSWGKAVKERSLLDVTSCDEPRPIPFMEERPELVIRLMRRHDRSQYHLGGVSFAGYDVAPMDELMNLVVNTTFLSMELSGYDKQEEFCRRLREVGRVMAHLGSDRIAVRLLVLQPLPPDSNPNDFPSATVKAGYVVGGLAGAVVGSAIDSARTPTEAQVSKDMEERRKQMDMLIGGDVKNPSLDSLNKIAKDLSWVVEVC